MQVEEQHQDKLSSITHSPYYGCTVRVVSKARVSYEGVLDGISTNKDRIFLKNVHVNANITASPNRTNSVDDLNKSSTSDTLNAVMIDHLTNDIRRYEQVCLNVRDIQELRLIQLPSTFQESKSKLRAIDPCLVDIRLSTSDEHETVSSGSPNESHRQRAPIARQKRGESFGSNGGSALISSSSNESSSSFGHRSGEKFADESNDDSIDEQIEKFSQLTILPNVNSKPATLIAKKVLPKKFDRRPDVPPTSVANNARPVFNNNREPLYASPLGNNQNTLKKPPMINQHRRLSPIRVTITSKLNPDAIPFYAQQRNLRATQNPSFTFYERPRFRPRLQPVLSPDRSQSLPYGINATNHNYQQQQQQQQQNHSHQRFVPPRQMAIKKNYTHTTHIRPALAPPPPPPPMAKYRIQSSSFSDNRSYPQQQQLQQQQQQQQQQLKHKTPNSAQFPGLMRHTSLPGPPIISKPPIQDRLSIQRNNHPRQSITSIRSTASLPYPIESSGDRNQIQTSSSFGEPVGLRRAQRTFSGASSCSSVSFDIGPHSIVQFDSASNLSTSFEEQYDFEKANEEFRRYLELEELVTRRKSSHCSIGSHPDDNSTQQQSNSYKKENSFFDRISCTATTGTAVGYTEMDETEKNRETFGDDALLMSSDSK